jgi:hypothetical protein
MHAAVMDIGEILGMSLEITKYIINVSCIENLHCKHICPIFFFLSAFWLSTPANLKFDVKAF